MFIRSLLATAALAALLPAAQAAQINFGAVSVGATLNLVPAGATQAKGDSLYTFSLSSTVSNVTLSLAGTGLSMAGITGISSGLLPVAILYTMPQGGGSFSFGSLAAGSYSLLVGGLYNEVFTGTMKFAAPVPEAGQGVMLLAGLAGVAALARRRRARSSARVLPA